MDQSEVRFPISLANWITSMAENRRLSEWQAVIYETNLPLAQNHVRGSIVVSISARHAEDPGSIPGRGVS